MAVIYSQITEVKLSDVWLWPNQCKDMKKYNLFVQWILIMGERRRFPIPMQTLYAISNFLRNVNTNNQWLNETFLKVLFKLQSSKILQCWFSKFCNKSKKQKTWKKTKSSLSKKNFDNKEKENQTINIEQSMKTPTKTFNDSKNTKQTKESLNMNENCSFWNKNQLKKHQILNFQSIPDLWPVQHIRSQ